MEVIRCNKEETKRAVAATHREKDFLRNNTAVGDAAQSNEEIGRDEHAPHFGGWKSQQQQQQKQQQ